MTSRADPSRRLILPDDAPYLKNLSALWSADPQLAAAIEATAAQPSHRTEPSRSGEPTVSVLTDDGRTVHVHSRYQPLAEADKLLAGIDFADAAAFYVHGFGLGYHVDRLFQRAADDAILCIFEPDLVMLRIAFEQRDFSAMIESGRLIWLWQLDKVELFARLHPHQPLVSIGIQRVEHPPSVQLHRAFHTQMQTWTGEFEAYAKTTVSTLVINSRRTAENLAANLPWYVVAPGLARLENAFRGKPAVIVSAGPSLRKNKHLLRDIAGNAVIIAVQTTLQPLLEIGVEPHFVTSLDYHDICTRFFERLAPTLRTELVAEPKATPAIFEMNPGPLTLLGNDFSEMLLAEMKLNKPRLRSGATVAHLAYYLAEHLGCDPIIFIGQDLGFSDGLCYAPGTSYDEVWRSELSRFCTVEMKQWEQIVRDRAILRQVPDYQNRPMYTEERLFTYLQHFERDFAQTKTRIIDASEGGVRKRGAEVMTFADAIRQFCARPLVAAVPPHRGLRWERLEECTASLGRRLEEARQIERISRQTLALLEEVCEHLTDQPRFNRCIAKIDVLRARVHELGACYGLILQLTQRSEMSRFTADRRIAAAKVDGVERQRRQVRRDIDNVRAITDAAEAFQNLMLNAMDHVRSFGQRARKEAA